MSNLKEFKDLYDKVKEEKAYVIRYESTGNVVGYKPAPDLLIGRIPVYEMEYVVRELHLKRKDDLFTFLMGTYGERIFDSKEEAEKKCKELNEVELEKGDIEL